MNVIYQDRWGLKLTSINLLPNIELSQGIGRIRKDLGLEYTKLDFTTPGLFLFGNKALEFVRQYQNKNNLNETY